MKSLGLIGGLGPETTVEYYRLLISRYREKTGGDYPSIIVNSVDLKLFLHLMTVNELDNAVEYLVPQLFRLHRAGVDFAAFASNTPHIVFEELQRRSPLRLVSIVEATANFARTLGRKKLGLLGARFTMQGSFYQTAFARHGMQLVTPSSDDQITIHDKYMNELLNNVFLPETRSKVLAIIDEMRSREQVEAIVLGGTELPLLLRSEEHNGLPLLDTASIHVDALVAEMLT